jgi:broad specificity phosphatase PhoE
LINRCFGYFVPALVRSSLASIRRNLIQIYSFSFVDDGETTPSGGAVTATILLVLHAAHVELGEVLSGRRNDVALSRNGLEQAEILGDLLGTARIDAVYSSPRERAWYTARDIADRHGLKPSLVEDLDEVDFGDWAGRRFADLEGDPAWQTWNERRGTARCPGGETMAAAVERAWRALSEIARLHAGRQSVAVSHCDIIRGLIARILGLPLDRMLRFDVDPASVSRVTVGGWGARVASINERLLQWT